MGMASQRELKFQLTEVYYSEFVKSPFLPEN